MASSNIVGRRRNSPKASAPAIVILKIIFCFIPIAQIGFGAKYLHECPREPYIPIFLIVFGVFFLIVVLLSCLPSVKEPEDGTSNPLSTICTAWSSLKILFFFCWGITGNVWIYSIYQPNYDKNTTNMDPYCNKNLYLFAVCLTTVGNVLFSLCMLCGFLYLICVLLCGIINPGNNREQVLEMRGRDAAEAKMFETLF